MFNFFFNLRTSIKKTFLCDWQSEWGFIEIARTLKFKEFSFNFS